MAHCNQDMVEVQNRLRPLDPNEAALTIRGQLLPVKELTRHLTGVMLDDAECKFVQLLSKKFGDTLSNLNIFVQTIIKSTVT